MIAVNEPTDPNLDEEFDDGILFGGDDNAQGDVDDVDGLGPDITNEGGAQ